MAKTVIINGVTYSDVSEVKLPLAADTSTFAVFPDTSGASAAAGDIRSGKGAYVDGALLTGTLALPTFSLTSGVLSIA